jgi:hypothetical protein
VSLSKSIGASLDRMFRSNPELDGFSKLKASGQDLRRFFQATPFAEREILFYLDKWWEKDTGGQVYVELFCLVPAVQLALTGLAQSLEMPDYNVPFTHFQYATGEPSQKRSWEIHSAADVADFEIQMKSWLSSVALPWLARFSSLQGTMTHMRDQRQFHMLAMLLASQGDRAGAQDAAVAWLRSLPRQIEKKLQKLAAVGLLSAQDETVLLNASIQSEELYRERLNGWLASARADGGLAA